MASAGGHVVSACAFGACATPSRSAVNRTVVAAKAAAAVNVRRGTSQPVISWCPFLLRPLAPKPRSGDRPGSANNPDAPCGWLPPAATAAGVGGTGEVWAGPSLACSSPTSSAMPQNRLASNRRRRRGLPPQVFPRGSSEPQPDSASGPPRFVRNVMIRTPASVVTRRFP